MRLSRFRGRHERWRNVYSEMEAINIIANKVEEIVDTINGLIPFNPEDVVLVPGRTGYWLGVIYMASGGISLVECANGLVPVNNEDLIYVGEL